VIKEYKPGAREQLKRVAGRTIPVWQAIEDGRFLR
jgi:hypothetical protein